MFLKLLFLISQDGKNVIFFNFHKSHTVLNVNILVKSYNRWSQFAACERYDLNSRWKVELKIHPSHFCTLTRTNWSGFVQMTFWQKLVNPFFSRHATLPKLLYAWQSGIKRLIWSQFDKNVILKKTIYVALYY